MIHGAMDYQYFDAGSGSPHSLPFDDAVRDLDAAKSQADISLPFYFILCVLDSKGSEDFGIYKDNAMAMHLF
jgi:hypothetical protein